MNNRLDREVSIENFAKRAKEGKGLGPVLEQGNDLANEYRDYVTNRIIKKHIDLKRQDVVLDFGCGVGRVARFLAPHCKQIEAVDATPEMIRYAQQNFTNPPNVNYHLLSTRALPFADSSFDKIFTFWVMQHMGDDLVSDTLREFKRVLKPGGKIVLFEQTLPETVVHENWSLQRSPTHYANLAIESGTVLSDWKHVMRNPSRGMSIWLNIGGKIPWIKPILEELDRITIKRKPQHVFYYTTAFELFR